MTSQAMHVWLSVAPAVLEYFPRVQAVHSAEPSTSLYLPATHARQGPPSCPVYPALHLQSVTSSLPICETVLLGHSEHAADPGPVLNLPSEHHSHGPPSGPVEPAAHLSEHDCSDVLPGGVVKPDEHGTQLESPLMLLYVPEEQLVQPPPFGPVWPALHAHAAEEMLPAGEWALASQAIHVVLRVAPGVLKYFPTSHSVQGVSPAVSLYLPAKHLTQGPPSGPVNPLLHGVLS